MLFIKDYLKNYFVLSFMLMIVSYLLPREEYKKYFQFIAAVIVTAVIFAPVMDKLFNKNLNNDSFRELTNKIQKIEYQNEKKEDLFGLFKFRQNLHEDIGSDTEEK